MKELEDQYWFPKILRQFQTEYIGFLVYAFGIYRPLIKYLNIEKPSTEILFDLCSGSGHSSLYVFNKSKFFSKLIHSDKFPFKSLKSNKYIENIETSLDVLNIDFQSRYTYFMFNAFHHFTDQEKLEIVSKIKKSKVELYIIEILQPNIICLLKVLFATTIGQLIIMPFVKPYNIKRILYTYILPINLLTIPIDGIISVFKSKSVKQFERLFVNQINPINIKVLHRFFTPITVIHIKKT